ncbi:hypothetical protein ZEAMMB73_Zm00001d024450 [Zea mays]|uniref:Uncharacterized protein n=1 Tax=Zea mays TaxID=4577 RepID=A0A1D6IZC2_MAIZE|nr:hypothetical protein ZEAMMB73_Zm00001d024450 [Zea mays]
MAGIIIKMLVLCAGWEIARGIVFSSLGSPALCVPVPCFVLFGFSFYASSPVLLQIERIFSSRCVLQIERGYIATQHNTQASNARPMVAVIFIVVSLNDTSSSPHEDLLLSHMKTCCLIMVFVYEDQLPVPTRWTEYLYDVKVNCSASSV